MIKKLKMLLLVMPFILFGCQANDKPITLDGLEVTVIEQLEIGQPFVIPFNIRFSDEAWENPNYVMSLSVGIGSNFIPIALLSCDLNDGTMCINAGVINCMMAADETVSCASFPGTTLPPYKSKSLAHLPGEAFLVGMACTRMLQPDGTTMPECDRKVFPLTITHKRRPVVFDENAM